MSQTNGTAKKKLLRNPTSAYRPNGAWWGYPAAVLDGAPFFTYLDIPRMLRDPRVRFVERMWRAPFQRVKWAVRAEDKKVARFVDAGLRRFWRNSLPRLLSRYFRYGYAPGGAEFVARKGHVVLDRVRAVEPGDARPLVWASGPEKGKPAGFTLATKGGGSPWSPAQDSLESDSYVGHPHAMWFAGYAELSPWYDMPPMAGMFEPWLEKRGRNGAIHARRLWYRKCAFRGGKLYHPPGTSNLGTDENPRVVDNQDIARSTLEAMESGSVFTAENDVNAASPERYAWDFEEAAAQADVAGVREYPKDLDAEMLEGVGIPPEVLEAADVGSGWSGRLIPLIGFLGGVDELAGLAVEAADSGWLRGLVDAEFGRGAYYEVEPLSLAEEVQRQGNGNRAGANPFPALFNPQVQQQARPRQMSWRADPRHAPHADAAGTKLSWTAYTGEHGGRGWKNDQTGEVRYQENRPDDSGGGPTGDDTDSRARRIIRALRSLPKRIIKAAREVVAAAYRRLENRYGPGYAKAIFRVALAGVPVPIPGAVVASGIAAAIPLAIAELHLRLKRMGPAEPQGADVDGVVKPAARNLLARLLGRRGRDLSTLSSRDDFERKIDENPLEATSHAAYADFLDEEGDHDEAAFRRSMAKWLQDRAHATPANPHPLHVAPAPPGPGTRPWIVYGRARSRDADGEPLDTPHFPEGVEGVTAYEPMFNLTYDRRGQWLHDGQQPHHGRRISAYGGGTAWRTYREMEAALRESFLDGRRRRREASEELSDGRPDDPFGLLPERPPPEPRALELYSREHDEADFHAKIHENPHEATAGMAYADWLREQGLHAHAEVVESHARRRGDAGDVRDREEYDITSPDPTRPWETAVTAGAPLAGGSVPRIGLHRRSAADPAGVIQWLHAAPIPRDEAAKLVRRLVAESRRRIPDGGGVLTNEHADELLRHGLPEFVKRTVVPESGLLGPRHGGGGAHWVYSWRPRPSADGRWVWERQDNPSRIPNAEEAARFVEAGGGVPHRELFPAGHYHRIQRELNPDELRHWKRLLAEAGEPEEFHTGHGPPKNLSDGRGEQPPRWTVPEPAETTPHDHLIDPAVARWSKWEPTADNPAPYHLLTSLDHNRTQYDLDKVDPGYLDRTDDNLSRGPSGDFHDMAAVLAGTKKAAWVGAGLLSHPVFRSLVARLRAKGHEAGLSKDGRSLFVGHPESVASLRNLDPDALPRRHVGMRGMPGEDAGGAERHTTVGRALGYPEGAIRKFVEGRTDYGGRNPSLVRRLRGALGLADGRGEPDLKFSGPQKVTEGTPGSQPPHAATPGVRSTPTGDEDWRKEDWEPHVGPRGGKNLWRNRYTGDVVRRAARPGGPRPRGGPSTRSGSGGSPSRPTSSRPAPPSTPSAPWRRTASRRTTSWAWPATCRAAGSTSPTRRPPPATTA